MTSSGPASGTARFALTLSGRNSQHRSMAAQTLAQPAQTLLHVFKQLALASCLANSSFSV